MPRISELDSARWKPAESDLERLLTPCLIVHLDRVRGNIKRVLEHLQGDPGRIRQILTNLVGNAVKFTERGEIAIRVSVVSEGDDTVELRFSVRDSGIGIPEDKVGLLFQQFTQVDSSMVRRYGGTGLGLSMSRRLAEGLGGELLGFSEEGKGSRFVLTVPDLSEDFRESGDLSDVGDTGSGEERIWEE